MTEVYKVVVFLFTAAHLIAQAEKNWNTSDTRVIRKENKATDWFDKHIPIIEFYATSHWIQH